MSERTYRATVEYAVGEPMEPRMVFFTADDGAMLIAEASMASNGTLTLRLSNVPSDFAAALPPAGESGGE